ELRLEQDLPRGVSARLRDEHISRPGGEEIGHVEAGGAAQQTRHALFEQQALDELRLRLVARTRDTHELALSELRLDLAGALVSVGYGLPARAGRAGARVHEWHVASSAEALLRRVRRPAARTDQKLGG